MKKREEDLINGALMLVIFTGAAAAGATVLAAEINQVFTYISARLAMYTTQTRAPTNLSTDCWGAAGRIGERLCETHV